MLEIRLITGERLLFDGDAMELMRDIGLAVFAAGIAAFGLSKISHRHLHLPNAALVATIGDAMMLAGASLAITAMAFGYFISAKAP